MNKSSLSPEVADALFHPILNYPKDKKAVIYAKSVRDMANKYRKQLTLCKKNLDKNKYIIF